MLALKILVAVAGLLIVAFLVWSWYVSRPIFDEVRDASERATIADSDVALTFARSADALIRVTAHDDDAVSGIDLTAALGIERTKDLVALYGELGYDGLLAVQGETVTVPLEALGMPVDFTWPFIAVGTNYTEHAEEVLLDDPPFLFPKRARPTAWNAPVNFTARLDYEAELGMVPLTDIEGPAADVEYGLVLVNDFTDRWTLIRQLKLGAPMGTTGFADAKGRESFLPTGYLFVIPRTRALHGTLRHRLWVNDALRQRFVAGDMILSIDDIVRQSFDQQERVFQSSDGAIPLMPEGHIPRGTLILTGTAAGVIFKPANIWLQRLYLARGDEVRTGADGLGQLVNRVR